MANTLWDVRKVARARLHQGQESQERRCEGNRNDKYGVNGLDWDYKWARLQHVPEISSRNNETVESQQLSVEVGEPHQSERTHS